MLGWLRALLGAKPLVVEGTDKLADGHARKMVFGDPIAGEGVEIVLCRVGGELHALDSRCPHEGGRITEGPLVDGKYAVCPLHGYQFEPSTGAAVNAACHKARRYRVRESGGRCEIRL